MFGEMIGAWCIDCWHRMGRPAPFALAEFGPGRGTLMADLLRIAAMDTEFRAAIRVHLVETSPTLRAAQRAALADVAVSWHDGIATLPRLPLLAIANEFVDALPVRQFERSAAGWCERLVDIDPAGAAPEEFRFVLSAPLDPASDFIVIDVFLPAFVDAFGARRLDPGALPAPADAPPGAIAEACPQGRTFAAELAGRIVADGGAALLVDYGYDHGHGDTLQAVRRHRFVPFLAAPGDADLTAHVDFAALATAAKAVGATVHGPVTQGEFLRMLGIETRAARLTAKAAPAQRAEIAGALRRLIADDEMGRLFRTIAFAAPGLPGLAGFAPNAT